MERLGMKERAATQCVRSHLWVLQWCGFWRVSRGASRRRRALHALYRGAALATTAGYVAQQAVFAVRERAHRDRLTRTLFVLMCHFTSLVKQIVFHYDADRIDRLVDDLADSCFNTDSALAQRLQRDCCYAARRLHAWYSGAAAATCLLWLLPPIADAVRSRTTQFYFTSFFDYDHPAGFVLTMLNSFYATTLVAVANTTMDAFMATILAQCKTQITILRSDLEALLETAAAVGSPDSQESPDSLERAVRGGLRAAMRHHRRIRQEAELLEAVFGRALLVQFAAGGWILGVSAYTMATVEGGAVELASTALFAGCILAELLVYCHYGNELQHESDLISTSVYMSSWERGVPAAVGSSILLALTGSARPLSPRAAGLVPLSLDTFVKILKSSYTFYAVLRQTK